MSGYNNGWLLAGLQIECSACLLEVQDILHWPIYSEKEVGINENTYSEGQARRFLPAAVRGSVLILADKRRLEFVLRLYRRVKLYTVKWGRL
jgi:hypothetical protein